MHALNNTTQTHKGRERERAYHGYDLWVRKRKIGWNKKIHIGDTVNIGIKTMGFFLKQKRKKNKSLVRFGCRFKMLLSINVQLLFTPNLQYVSNTNCKRVGLRNPRERKALKRVLITAVGPPRCCQHWAYQHLSTTLYPTNFTVVATQG